MLRRYLLQTTLVIILAVAAGICLNALLDYGHTHSVSSNNERIRIGGGPPREVPPRPEHNQRMHPPERRAGPSPAPGTFPASPDKRPADNNGTASTSLRLLLIFTVIFLPLAMLTYYLTDRGKIASSSGNARLVLPALLLLGLLFRLYLATMVEGHAGDLSFFRNWSTAAAKDLSHFYINSRCDYPPLYIYVLWLLGKANHLSVLQPYSTLILKLPSMLADLLTASLIYCWSRPRLKQEVGILLAAFYIFNPAVLVNSTLWGQVDSCFTLLLTLALWTLTKSRIAISSALFSALVLMKPQGIIFLPVLAFELLRQKNWRIILKALAASTSVALIIILPFAWRQGAGWILSLFSGTVGEYPFASVNAFNFFYLLGANYAPDNQIPFLTTYHNWGMLSIVLTTAYAWWGYARKNTPRMAPATALLLITGVFTLGPSMHERYLFPTVALALLAYMALADKRFLWLAGGFSISIAVNTGLVLLAGSYGLAGSLVAILNILLLVYLIWVFYDSKPRWEFSAGID